MDKGNRRLLFNKLGFIKNHVIGNRRHKIYKDNTYNRFCYGSKYLVYRDELLEKNRDIVEMLETMIFRGYSHLKRGQGITCVPKKKLQDPRRNEKIMTFIMEVFREKFL